MTANCPLRNALCRLVCEIAHAEPGSKTEGLCKDALAAGKPVFALDSAGNAHLVELGAISIPVDNPETLLSRQQKNDETTCG